MNCPICNKELQLTDTYCPECGFEQHIYPEPLSPAQKEYEEERVNKYKEQRTKKEEELKKQEDAFEKITAQLSEAQDKLKQNEKVLESAYAKSEEDKHRIAELEKKIADVQQYTKSTEANTALAYLVMTSRDKVSAIYEIHEGENSFGYSNSNGNHHQIICDQPIADKHFVINAKTTLSQRGVKRTEFTVKPCEGKIFGAKGGANLFNTEVVLEKNSSIYIGEIRFTLVSNKQ